MTLVDNYIQRKEQFAETAKILSAKYNRFSIFRLIFFVLTIGILIFLFSQNVWLGIVGTIILLTLFARFVFWHQGFQKERKHNSNLSLINKNEEAAMKDNHSAFDGGKEFISADHPYAYDLDIFGDHSIFQFCNRTVTNIGKEKLSNILGVTADKKTILERQEAISELADKLDWRQNFQSYGSEIDDKPEHLRILKDWLQDEPFILNNKLITVLRFIVPVLSITGLVLFFVQPWYIAILFLIPAFWAIRKTVVQVNDTHQRTTHTEKILASYATLIAHIEQENFSSPLLQSWKAALTVNENVPSKKIKRLSYIISQLNVRYNAFAILLNIIGLWDIHWVASLEKWKAKHKDELPKWFDSLKNFDALISLATLAYNHPEWTFPIITEDAYLKGIELGHPLIPRQQMVTNNLEMETTGHIKLVTGSNMAGKSTFLRTIALNIVLAQTGSKVCAKELSLPHLAVYTSMRTTDALHESTSSFYAELKRLKIILDAVDRKEQVYFLLDEILKGTNSKDRHTGSKALIEQLIKSGGAGIIATHDLELGSLEAKYNGDLENLCMEVEVKDGELDFDYKLKKGVSKSFNATTLMRNMGIRIAE